MEMLKSLVTNIKIKYLLHSKMESNFGRKIESLVTYLKNLKNYR